MKVGDCHGDRQLTVMVTDITLCFNLEINLTNKPDGLPVSELVDLWKVGVPKPRKLI